MKSAVSIGTAVTTSVTVSSSALKFATFCQYIEYFIYFVVLFDYCNEQSGFTGILFLVCLNIIFSTGN